MKRICYIVAMRAEAKPFIEHYGVVEQKDFFAPLPCILYKGVVNGSELFVVLNGAQHDSDLIGCEAAVVATMSAIQRLHPDIVISSGTCGGWQRYGMKVGEVYLGNAVMFHDRRVPGDNAWATQGLGNYPVYEETEAIAQQLGLPTAKVTTGSSFDMTKEEEEIIDANGGRLKEMEGAAVAFVCSLYQIPVMFVKAVCNLRDAEEENMDAFQRNLVRVSQNLNDANIRLISILSNK